MQIQKIFRSKWMIQLIKTKIQIMQVIKYFTFGFNIGVYSVSCVSNMAFLT